MEAREALHGDLLSSLTVVKKEYVALKKIMAGKTDPDSTIDNGLLEYYGPPKAETIIVALGSVTGTIRETIKNNKKVGLLKIKVYRPFPGEEITKIIKSAKNIAVIEKALSYGQAGPLYSDISTALIAQKIKNNLMFLFFTFFLIR